LYDGVGSGDITAALVSEDCMDFEGFNDYTDAAV
jgi:hypothetical protein